MLVSGEGQLTNDFKEGNTWMWPKGQSDALGSMGEPSTHLPHEYGTAKASEEGLEVTKGEVFRTHIGKLESQKWFQTPEAEFRAENHTENSLGRLFYCICSC